MLPKFLYGYISGGAETDAALRNNRDAFDEYGFVPRVLNDARDGPDHDAVQQAVRVALRHSADGLVRAVRLSRRHSYARGGGCGQRADDPQRGVADRLEDVIKENPQAWYQAYLAGDPERIEPLVERVAAAGFDTFVVTADVPVPPNRENNIRNGFQTPIKITPRVAWER